MAKTLTPSDLVQLPRLSAAEALVLATELLTEAGNHGAGKKGFPAAIERSRKRLEGVAGVLAEVLRPPPASSADPQAKRAADMVVDNAYSGAFDWLSGWCKLPESRNPQLARCQKALAGIFPTKLAFTKLPYKVEWQESKARLEVIERDGHDKLFAELGGAAFIEQIKEAHEAYGRALHITAPLPDAQATQRIGEQRAAMLEALCDYTTRVIAHADPDDEGSEKLAAALLRPLTSWESRSPSPEPPAPPAGPTG